MATPTVPSADDALGDPDAPLVQAVTLVIDRGTPVRIMGRAGGQSASLRLGGLNSHVAFVVRPALGSSRLADLEAIQDVLAHAILAVRLAVREEADMVRADAARAQRVEARADEQLAS